MTESSSDAAEPSATPTELTADVQELLDLVHEAASAKLARSPVAIDLRELTTMTDVLYVCHADSRPAVEAIVDGVRRAFKQSGRKVPHVEGLGPDPQWVLMDLGSLMVHVFRGERREFYGLERLWSDGRRLSLEEG